MTDLEADGEMNNDQGHSSHLTTEQLLDYLEQKLAVEEVRIVEEHLATDCANCQSELEWYKNTIGLMASDPWLEPSLQLRHSAQRFFREHHQVNTTRAQGRSVSLGEWLRSLFDQPRPLAVGFAAAIALVIVSALIFQFWSNQSGSEQASVAAIQGMVFTQTDNSDIWKPVTSESSVEEGDLVRTGDDSSVVLTYPDDSHTTVAPNSELTILLMASAEDGSRQEIVLRQEIGSTRNVVQPLPSADSKFEIQTPSAIVTVRGTEFMVDVDSSGATMVAVDEGIVEVSAQGMTVTLNAGETTTVSPGSPPATAEPIPTVTKPPNKATPLSSRSEPLSGTPENNQDPVDVETSTPIRPSRTPIASEDTLTRTPPNASATPDISETPSIDPTSTPAPSLTPAPTDTPDPTPTNTPKPTKEPTAEPPPPPEPTSPPPPTEPPPPEPTSPPPPTVPPPTAPPPPPPTDPPPPPPTEPPPPPPPTSESESSTWTPPGLTKTPQPPGRTRNP